MTSERLKQAVALTRQGEKDEARVILAEMIQEDVHNEMAWLWYADTMPTVDAKAEALRECLYHNPSSENARRGLERLGAQTESSPVQAQDYAVREAEPPPEPEPWTSYEPTTSAVPRAEMAYPMGEPQGAAQFDEEVNAMATKRGAPGLRLLAYFVAALIGAFALGYVGLLVVGQRVVSPADLQNAVSNWSALIAAAVGVVFGAAVGVLIVRAIFVRSRTAR